jgi:hypothetical protein
VHVENDVDAMVQGVLRMRDNLARFQIEVEELRHQRIHEWNRIEAELQQMIGGR